MVHVAIPIARRIRAFAQAWLAPVLLWIALVSTGPVEAWAAPLFAPPKPLAPADEILIVSTRAIGLACDGQRLSDGLRCRRLQIGTKGRPHWESVDWREALQPASLAGEPGLPTRTVIYIHGNRVEQGEDLQRGMMVYRSLTTRGRPRQPIRYIIWSWPSTTIPGLIKDMKIKAARTCPAGWQLAWFLDQLPAEMPVSLIGYSYGARVASGALHLLGGGQLNGKRLTERLHPQRPPIRVAMLAAAFNADWILPGKYHGRAVSQMEELLLVTNQRDPAMRLFHFTVHSGRTHALGKEGVPRPQALGKSARRIMPINLTHAVGRSHLLTDYLAVKGKMSAIWRRLIPREEPLGKTDKPALVGVASPAQS